MQGSTVVEQTLEVDGRKWAMTCVSMGNPHAITYSVDGQLIKVGGDSQQLTASYTQAAWTLFFVCL